MRPAASAASGNPVAGRRFYAMPGWRADEIAALKTQGRSADAALLKRIAAMQAGVWITGIWNDRDLTRLMVNGARKSGRQALLVAYNIPRRDCGSYASGGAASATAYRRWVDTLSRDIGNSHTVLIIEPDALHVTNCLSPNELRERIGLIRYAAKTFAARNPNTVTYIATPTGWDDVPQMASRLKAAGVGYTRGVALNVSDFASTPVVEKYAKRLIAQTGLRLHAVIDTSRNGSGRYVSDNPEATWCNPPGRTFGAINTTKTKSSQVDAYLWIKGSGGDGACSQSNPISDLDYTLDMARRSLD